MSRCSSIIKAINTAVELLLKIATASADEHDPFNATAHYSRRYHTSRSNAHNLSVYSAKGTAVVVAHFSLEQYGTAVRETSAAE